MSVEPVLDAAVPISAERNTLSRVEELLAANQEPATPEGPGEVQESANQQAETPEPESIYSHKVKVGDGHELTVGELKDAWKSKADLEQVEKNLTQERANWQADQLRNQRELEEILSSIDPAQVNPQLIQARQRQFEEYKSRERESLLRKLPEWSSAKTETADRAEILDLIKGYGYAPADLDHVHDHRLLRLVRDYAKLQAKVKAAEVKPQPKVAARPTRSAPQSPAQQFGRTKAAVTSGRLSPLAAVEKILQGKA